METKRSSMVVVFRLKLNFNMTLCAFISHQVSVVGCVLLVLLQHKCGQFQMRIFIPSLIFISHIYQYMIRYKCPDPFVHKPSLKILEPWPVRSQYNQRQSWQQWANINYFCYPYSQTAVYIHLYSPKWQHTKRKYKHTNKKQYKNTNDTLCTFTEHYNIHKMY